MKKSLSSFALLIVALTLVGCDHSTNNQIPPEGAELAIVNPTEDAVVNGTVKVSVDASALDKVTKVELFVNGQLAQARTAPPWQFDWNTTSLTPNSFHTLQSKAYGLSQNYSVSQAITVRIQ